MRLLPVILFSLTLPAFAGDVLVSTPSDQASLDLYSFQVSTCDTIRAEVKDARPADAPRSAEVMVELRNNSPTACTWIGVVLKGFLAGVYNTNRNDPTQEGFTLAPGDAVLIKVTPDDLTLPRGTVQLQIPPEKGIIVLIGQPPDASATPVAPPPAAEPEPVGKPKKEPKKPRGS